MTHSIPSPFASSTRANLDLIEYFRKRINGLLEKYYPKDHALYDPLKRALFYSRRRLRATLAYCGSGMASSTSESADKIAMAYEIITADYVLIDDSIIMDSGTLRAKMPTPRMEYGEMTAILCACILQLESIRLLPDNKQLKEIFYQSSSDTVIGWRNEHELTQLPSDVVVEDSKIIETCRLLTGPLLAGALTSGMIIGGATPEEINAVRSYAMDFGCAYQLLDHIVDSMQLSEASGKDNFSDVQTNKKNIVINQALKVLPKDSPQRQTIIDALGTSPSSRQKEKLQRIFQESKSIEHCLGLVKKFSSSAVSHLQRFPVSKYRSLLEAIPKMYVDELISTMKTVKVT